MLADETKYIQLFQERLSNKSVKAYTTMSKGSMGNVVSSCLIKA